MASLAKSGSPSLATLNPPPPHQKTLISAVDLAAGDYVYITSAGLFDKTDGTTLNAAATKGFGMVLRASKAGQPVTAFWGVEVRYGSGLTPGTPYYLDTVTGGLNSAAQTGGTIAVATATDATCLFIHPPVR